MSNVVACFVGVDSIVERQPSDLRSQSEVEVRASWVDVKRSGDGYTTGEEVQMHLLLLLLLSNKRAVADPRRSRAGGPEHNANIYIVARPQERYWCPIRMSFMPPMSWVSLGDWWQTIKGGTKGQLAEFEIGRAHV